MGQIDAFFKIPETVVNESLEWGIWMLVTTYLMPFAQDDQLRFMRYRLGDLEDMISRILDPLVIRGKIQNYNRNQIKTAVVSSIEDYLTEFGVDMGTLSYSVDGVDFIITRTL